MSRSILTPDRLTVTTMSDTRRSNLANVYLALAILGYLLPGIPMLIESVQTGNVLFWLDPARTNAELFVNRTSTAFALDLLAVVATALLWMTREAARLGMRAVWRFWVLTLLFGLGGTLPLFLWFRERRLGAAEARGAAGSVAA